MSFMDPDTGDLGITQTMKNVSDKEAGFCLWDRTLCRGGGFALILLNKKSRFAAGWSIRTQVDGRYVYDGTNPHSPNVKVNKGVLVAKAEGEATKIGADSDVEIVVYPPRKSFYELLSEQLSGSSDSLQGAALGAWMHTNLSKGEIEALRAIRGPLSMFRPGEILALMPFTFLR
jgi:hypothetical protein